MNDSKIIEYLVGTVISTLGLVAMVVTYLFKKVEARVDDIEDDYMTRDDFKDAFQLIREDRQMMHRENRDALLRIEGKIDESEGKNSNHRHSMNNEIQKLIAGSAVVESKVEDLRRAAANKQ
jgi:hypothetical protein